MGSTILKLAFVVPLVSAALGSRPTAADSHQVGGEMIRQANLAAGLRATPACANPDRDPACANAARYDITNPYHPELIGGAAWNLAQYGSLSNIPSVAAAAGDHYLLATPQKALRFFEDGRVEMAISGDSESGGSYQNWSADRKWPHLLLSQGISNPTGDGRSSGNLTQLQTLDFNMDVRLMYNDRHERPGYDAKKYAGQFPLFFTVQNLREGSPGYGEYVWLGLPIFDDRDANMPVHAMFDEGTKMLMYSLPSAAFGGDRVGSGEWTHLSADLLPHAKTAVSEAFKRGFLKSSDPSDYQIGSMNLGFEVTGLNILSVQFKGLSLSARLKNSNARPHAVAEGFYSLTDGGIFYSNGADAYCVFVDGETFFRWRGGRRDFNNLGTQSALPTGMNSTGVCQ